MGTSWPYFLSVPSGSNGGKMSIAVRATTHYLFCGSSQIPQAGGSILLWQTLRTQDEKMFLTQKVCSPSQIVTGVRVSFKEA